MTAPRDFGPTVIDFIGALDAGRLGQLAATLGVSSGSLSALGLGWYEQRRAFSFPMCDGHGRAIGIRLRGLDGRKFAVKGSKEGLFVPDLAPEDTSLMIAEGATDVAALLDMGFVNVIGRPSCSGGVTLVCDLVRHRQVEEAILLADQDEPGQRGANNLASVLLVYVPRVRVVFPPIGVKDIRQWLQVGGTRVDVETAITKATVQRGVFRARAGT
ncbi:MAG: toprim domain-containing protein [Gemmataceae bacterium]